MKSAMMIAAFALGSFAVAAQTTGAKVKGPTNTSSKAQVANSKTSAKKTAKEVTVPTHIAKAFADGNSSATHVKWANDNGSWTASYLNGTNSSTSTYEANGNKVITKTEIASDHYPKGVLFYCDHHPEMKVDQVFKVEKPGKDPVYEIKLRSGKTVLITEDGEEVSI